MPEITLLQQLLTGGTPLLLLAGLVVVAKLWYIDRGKHEESLKVAAERERELGEQYAERLMEQQSQYRRFTEEALAAQAVMLEKVAAALDRNSDAFDRFGNEQKAAERQNQIISMLEGRKTP